MTHPTISRVRERLAQLPPQPPRPSLAQVQQWCRELGADDVGVVSIDRPELDDQRQDILRHAPWTRTLVSFVCRMNREPIRTPARSAANLEFHHVGDHVNEVARALVTRLERAGVKAVNPSMGFPMEMDQFPGKIWVVSHKPVAVAAGLGQIGIHRNVIHPQFGNFILLGTILVELESTPLDDRPDNELEPSGAVANSTTATNRARAPVNSRRTRRQRSRKRRSSQTRRRSPAD